MSAEPDFQLRNAGLQTLPEWRASREVWRLDTQSRLAQSRATAQPADGVADGMPPEIDDLDFMRGFCFTNADR